MAVALFVLVLLIIIIVSSSGGPKAIIDFRIMTDKVWDDSDFDRFTSNELRWITEVNMKNQARNTGNWTIGFECSGDEVATYVAKF